MAWIGQSLRRREDARFLTGQGRYVADIDCPGALHMHVVRSPHAHARLGAIATQAACAMPGVAAVFTASDTAAIGPIPCHAAFPCAIPPRPALAREVVRYAGEPVAIVLAATAHQAADAAEAVQPEYDPLPCVVEARDALAPGAPQVWPGVPGNLAYTFTRGEPVDFTAAAHVTALELENNRVVAAPLEGRGGLAEWRDGRLLLTVSGQGVHAIRRDLAAMLGCELEVVAPDVGGGFGAKNGVYPEYVLLLFAARALRRPVRWAAGLTEDFLASSHGRDLWCRARLGLDEAARFTGLEIEAVANLGAGMATGGPGPSTTAMANAVGGGYAIPAAFLRTRGAFTHTAPLDAYRGAGKPEANYLLERLIDAAADELGLDRVELRMRNLVRHFPHRTPVGTTIDGGRFAANAAPALAAADAPGFPARAAAAPPGRRRGLGITCFLETARGALNEGAALRFGADGRVALHLGTQSNGQGHETSFPQIAADWLGLPVECFDLVQADTRRVTEGNGHGGARSLHMGSTALAEAVALVLERARPTAALLLQAGTEEVRYGDGQFVAGSRSAGLLEVARAAAAAGTPLDVDHWALQDRITFPNGWHVAEVEVDTATGEVALLRYAAADDFGAVVNPLLLVGQVQGGVAQGIGQALLERTVYDPASGQLLTGSFMDYCLPRAADLPPLDIRLHGTPTDANPLGVKGAGQAGAIAAPQAVVAAVLDALRPLGVRRLDMPLTPERVWRAIREANR